MNNISLSLSSVFYHLHQQHRWERSSTKSSWSWPWRSFHQCSGGSGYSWYGDSETLRNKPGNCNICRKTAQWEGIDKVSISVGENKGYCKHCHVLVLHLLQRDCQFFSRKSLAPCFYSRVFVASEKCW